jgi:hypothetical protein
MKPIFRFFRFEYSPAFLAFALLHTISDAMLTIPNFLAGLTTHITEALHLTLGTTAGTLVKLWILCGLGLFRFFRPNRYVFHFRV